jgi:hypothetical protein
MFFEDANLGNKLKVQGSFEFFKHLFNRLVLLGSFYLSKIRYLPKAF